jgi:hypothetical protein
LACRRLSRSARPVPDADGRQSDTAKEAFWPLFEALHWVVSIQNFDKKHGQRIDDPVSRSLRFVRNRVHHDWAAAIEARPFPVGTRSAARPSVTWFSFAWCWRPIEQLPPEGNREGEDEYRDHLADKRVRETLEHFATLLQ